MPKSKNQNTKLTKQWLEKKDGHWKKVRETVIMNPKVGVTDIAMPYEKSHSLFRTRDKAIYESISPDGKTKFVAIEERLKKKPEKRKNGEKIN